MSQYEMVAEQDLTSFAEFYRKEFGRLVGFVKRLIGGPLEDVIDIAQDAMMALWERVVKGGWSEIEKPFAYVRTIAHNKVFSYREKISNGPRQEALDGCEHVDRLYKTDAVGEQHLSFEVRYVEHLLEHLPARQREVMAWTFDGYGPTEIAEITGRNVATVRSHLRAAREYLEREIRRQGVIQFKNGDFKRFKKRLQDSQGKDDGEWSSMT
jgi:RNA polymerase sigma-70 factor (ECF subfamily)